MNREFCGEPGHVKITPHFSIKEFACKDGTPYPAKWIDWRLRPLCMLLEIVRKNVGGPIVIVSGYRTADYNRRIHGARQSRHVEGDAADIQRPGMTATQLHARILALDLRGDGAWLGAVDVPGAWLGGLGLYPRWVHVDIRPTTRLVRWTGGRTIA